MVLKCGHQRVERACVLIPNDLDMAAVSIRRTGSRPRSKRRAITPTKVTTRRLLIDHPSKRKLGIIALTLWAIFVRGLKKGESSAPTDCRLGLMHQQSKARLDSIASLIAL